MFLKLIRPPTDSAFVMSVDKLSSFKKNIESFRCDGCPCTFKRMYRNESV